MLLYYIIIQEFSIDKHALSVKIVKISNKQTIETGYNNYYDVHPEMYFQNPMKSISFTNSLGIVARLESVRQTRWMSRVAFEKHS